TRWPAAGDLQGGDVPATWCERLSFHFASSYDFPARDGSAQRVDDLAASCEAAAAPPAATPSGAPPAEEAPAEEAPANAAAPVLARALPATGGLPALAAVVLLGGAALLRRRG
ncbi:MAG TPA: hypothetical protein VNU66_05620, partial [Mycobacteriales bacterium]|nr:hypothetical protein [Mycobacteriales bacterium]